MHECAGRAGEYVYEVFRYSEAVRFLRGDSGSARAAGKSEKYGAPFQNNPLIARDLKSFRPAERWIRAQISTRHFITSIHIHPYLYFPLFKIVWPPSLSLTVNRETAWFFFWITYSVPCQLLLYPPLSHIFLLHASPYFTPGCPWSLKKNPAVTGDSREELSAAGSAFLQCTSTRRLPGRAVFFNTCMRARTHTHKGVLWSNLSIIQLHSPEIAPSRNCLFAFTRE